MVSGRPPPPPSHLSAKAQAHLAGLSAPEAYPPRSDLEAWRARVIAERAARAAQLGDGLERLPLSRERLELASAAVDRITPHRLDPASAGKAVLYFHGGGLVFGSGPMSTASAFISALRMEAETWGVDYRVPPDHPFPAALDDCMDAYRAALSRFGAESLAFIGLSAGANLAAATILRARDEGMPPPCSVVLAWPQLDLTESGDTFIASQDLDPSTDGLGECGRLYAGDEDLASPLISPLFGDVGAGFPPCLLISGTRDRLLSNAVRMHRHLRAAGREAELHVWEAAPHGGFGESSPEDLEMVRETRGFLYRHWARPAP